MKKIYEAPKLTNHGTVAHLTQQVGTDGTDTYVGPPIDGISNPGQGSIDICATTNQQSCDVP